MNDAKTHSLGWWLRLSLGIVALAFLLVLLLQPKAFLPSTVTLIIHTNGVAYLGPVSLANTNLQNKVFLALGTLGIETRIAIHTSTNGGGGMMPKKMAETLNNIGRAGLILRNQAPNPYE
jgi:hypothetical protein